MNNIYAALRFAIVFPLMSLLGILALPAGYAAAVLSVYALAEDLEWPTLAVPLSTRLLRETRWHLYQHPLLWARG